MVKDVSTATFSEEVLKSPTPVLVDFWAPWCGPCRAVSAVVDELARERAGSLKTVKVNVDENPDLANEYGILGIPTLLLFRGGRVIHQQVGAVKKADLVRALDRALATA